MYMIFEGLPATYIVLYLFWWWWWWWCHKDISMQNIYEVSNWGVKRTAGWSTSRWEPEMRTLTHCFVHLHCLNKVIYLMTWHFFFHFLFYCASVLSQSLSMSQTSLKQRFKKNLCYGTNWMDRNCRVHLTQVCLPEIVWNMQETLKKKQKKTEGVLHWV